MAGTTGAGGGSAAGAGAMGAGEAGAAAFGAGVVLAGGSPEVSSPSFEFVDDVGDAHATRSPASESGRRVRNVLFVFMM